jgi:hypothetical protein
MKVISQQAIGEQIRHRGQMLFIQLQKEIVIPCFIEDVLAVHSTIVDVIIGVEEKRRRAGHGFRSKP